MYDLYNLCLWIHCKYLGEKMFKFLVSDAFFLLIVKHQMLKTCTDCLALSLCMLFLAIQVMKLLFRGLHKNQCRFSCDRIFFLSYQIIVLDTCQTWKSCNNFNSIKHVKNLCCVFNGIQCMYRNWEINCCLYFHLLSRQSSHLTSLILLPHLDNQKVYSFISD